MATIKKLRNDADYYYDKAEKYIDVGDYVNAIDYFYRSLSLEPFNPWTMCELAGCYATMGLHLPALGLYYRALAFERNCDLAYLGIINFITMFGQQDTAAYYLKLCANTSAFDKITAEFDIDIDYGFEQEVIESNKKPVFRLTKNVKGEQFLSRAKRSLVSGDVEGALKNLEQVDYSSPSFGEAAYYASLINFDEGNFEKSLDYSDKLLQKDELDTRGYIIRVAVYDKTGDTDKKNQAVDKIMSIKPRSFVEAMGIAICFGDIGMSKEAEIFYEYASNYSPYEKSALVPLALCYHNNKKFDKSRRVMVDLCKIYPEDYSCVWFAKYLWTNKDVEVQPVNELPSEARKQLSIEILGILSKYGTIKELERAFDDNDDLFEKITMLFASNDFETIGYASEVLVLSAKLRPMLRQILVRIDAPFMIKQKCLTLLLQYGKKKEFSAYVSDVIRFYNPRIPRCSDDKFMVTAYWKSYATLSLLGLECEKKLFSVYKRFCKRAQEQNLKTEWVSEISAIMASIAFSEGVGQLVDTPMRKLRDFCELFDADVEKTEEISKIIGEEI